MAAVIPDVPPTGSGAGNLPVIILMDAKAFEDFKLELEALKRIGHEARKNAEMEKHKNPKTKKIRRSMRLRLMIVTLKENLLILLVCVIY